MPKPRGTYLKIKRQEIIKYRARQDKIIVSTKNKPETVRTLDAMLRKMAVLQDWIKNGALSSKSREDEIRENIAEAIEVFEKYIEKYQAYEQLEGELQESAPLILRAQPKIASHVDLLLLSITLCKVFSVLIRKVGRNDR